MKICTDVPYTGEENAATSSRLIFHTPIPWLLNKSYCVCSSTQSSRCNILKSCWICSHCWVGLKRNDHCALTANQKQNNLFCGVGVGRRMFVRRLRQQSVTCCNEARWTYSGFTGADLNNKHLQLKPYILFKTPPRLLMYMSLASDANRSGNLLLFCMIIRCLWPAWDGSQWPTPFPYYD